jgi:hypothetical protein
MHVCLSRPATKARRSYDVVAESQQKNKRLGILDKSKVWIPSTAGQLANHE